MEPTPQEILELEFKKKDEKMDKFHRFSIYGIMGGIVAGALWLLIKYLTP